MATIVAEIASASLEQSTGIESINKALIQMDEVTQQNSALVEENAATAKTLEHQAKALDEQVAYFQISDGVESEHNTQSEVARVKRPIAAARSKGSAAMPRRQQRAA